MGHTPLTGWSETSDLTEGRRPVMQKPVGIAPGWHAQKRVRRANGPGSMVGPRRKRSAHRPAHGRPDHLIIGAETAFRPGGASTLILAFPIPGALPPGYCIFGPLAQRSRRLNPTAGEITSRRYNKRPSPRPRSGRKAPARPTMKATPIATTAPRHRGADVCKRSQLDRARPERARKIGNPTANRAVRIATTIFARRSFWS